MVGIIGSKVPLISGVTEQKLIVAFSKQPDGNGAVSISFEPDIIEAISPEQRGAMDVAQIVISAINQSQKEQKEEVKDGKPTIN